MKAVWLLLPVNVLGFVPALRSFRSARAATTRTPLFSKELTRFSADDFAAEWPYGPNDFRRYDEQTDDVFYSNPRFVRHIDSGAIASITTHYAATLREGDDVLDLCSSWISHLPPALALGRVVGVGMNAEELAQNRRLDTWVARDLNAEPELPFDDSSFDAVCNVVSVDYLTRPREIFRETHRVLRPGGRAIMSFSNRCFQTKAVAKWLSSNDKGRMAIVADYFHFSGEWDEIVALDISPPYPGPPPSNLLDPTLVLAWLTPRDPMFVVQATKKKAN